MAPVKKLAKVFWTGRSQAVRLPKEFRVDAEILRVKRLGTGIFLEPADCWPDGYVESFVSPEPLSRPAQGTVEQRVSIDR